MSATGETAGGVVAEDPAPAAGPACPRCGAASSVGEQFCEACGSPLPVGAGATASSPADPGEPAAPTAELPATPAAEGPAPGAATPPCASCGGRVDADGYCEQCGVRARPARDHVVVVPAAWVAGVSDRGQRHRRNEDAVAAAAAGDVALLVVCDGVTTAPNSDVASAAAVAAAVQVMQDGVGRLGGPTSEGPAVATVPAPIEATRATEPTQAAADENDDEDGDEDGATSPALLAVADSVLGGSDGTATAAAWLLRDAAHAAAAAVLGTPAPEGEASSCTFVAAVVQGTTIVAGNVGDSRAYWLPDQGAAALLTLDDSWATELLSRGMPRAEAETAYGAHAITRWLGGDSPDTVPRCRLLDVEGPGWVLLCSDGLWNYCSEPQDLAGLVAACAGALGADLAPPTLAETLVAWANARGGHDNITVALARITVTESAAAEPAAADPTGAAPEPRPDSTAGTQPDTDPQPESDPQPDPDPSAGA